MESMTANKVKLNNVPMTATEHRKKNLFPLRPFKINLTYGFVIVEACVCVCVFERTLILQF